MKISRSNTLSIILFFAAAFVATQPAFAQRDLKEIPVPNPELERKSFIVPEGFEVNLFAADPMLAKPIQINFDTQGRLWVASSSVYPHIKPGQKANDRILVLEDKNGDGKADSTKIFAEGLLIPTGVEPGDGGAYVAAGTKLFHFSDTNGDGKADKKRVVLSGFGTEDTHHLLHTLRWGHDARLYFNQSIYIHTHIETPWGVRRLGGGGIWRFRPESKKLDVFARGFVNAWGHHFDKYGQSFATDGAYHDGINYVIPGAYYKSAVGAPRTLDGLNLGSPKHCGLEIISGRHMPDDWQGSMLTNDFRGHRVCRFVVTENKSGYASRQKIEVIRTDHVAFRPIDVKMGPDGAIYVADWYNPIIQHGEVDFHDPRRDRTHGRIWRITAKGRPLVPKIDLKNAKPNELLDAFKLPEQWTRIHARREIKNREAIATQKGKRKQFLTAWENRLGKWLDFKEEKETGDLKSFEESGRGDQLRLEALWTYQALGISNVALLEQLLLSKKGQVRAAAIRVKNDWKQMPELNAHATTKSLSEMVNDPHPRVRLEAVRALAQEKTTDAAITALKVLDHPMDRFLEYSLWLTLHELSPVWIEEIKQESFVWKGTSEQLLFLAKSVDAPEVVGLLLRTTQTTEMSAKLKSQFLARIGELGNAQQLRTIFKIALDEKTLTKERVSLLNVLSQATQNRKVKPTGDLKLIRKLLDSKEESTQLAALDCIGEWQQGDLVDSLLKITNDKKSSFSLRAAAIFALGKINSDQTVQALLKMTNPTKDERTRRDAIISLVRHRPWSVKKETAALLEKWKLPASESTTLFNAFLQRRGGVKVLTELLKERTMPAEVAKVGLRAISSSGRPHVELVQALSAAGNITSGPRKLSPEEMKTMMQLVREKGDAHRGEKIFRRDDLSCLKCHAIGGAGGKVGTDISSLGSTAQLDYLIESILDPAAKVKEGYHSIVVVTVKGKVFTGIPIKKTDSELVLRDANEKEVKIPTDDILKQSAGSSLMPTGLVDKLSDEQLYDLVAFLSALGKKEAFLVGSKQYVRSWEALLWTKDANFKIFRTRHGVVTTNNPVFQWKPVYTQVNGILPANNYDGFARNWRVKVKHKGFSFVRCYIKATTAGDIQLNFNQTAGLQCWLGEKPLELTKQTKITLKEGVNQLTFSFDKNAKGAANGLQLELTDIPGQPTQYKLVKPVK